MPYFKQIFMGMLIDKIAPHILGLDLLTFMYCIKKNLVKFFSGEYLMKSFDEMIALGKDVGADFMKAFQFFKTSFENALKKAKSLAEMKDFIVSVKDNVMELFNALNSLFNALNSLFNKMMSILNVYLNPLGSCQTISKGEEIGGIRSALMLVQGYSPMNLFNKWFEQYTPYGLLIKIGMDPQIVKDVIFISNELIIKVLINKVFDKSDWIGVGEVISRVLDFLLI